MYPSMRRKDRAVPREAAEALLRGCEYGVLATVSQDGQPYATPLSYVYLNDTIYFHCAMQGQKLDNITCQPKVCFTVVGDTLPVYDGDFTTLYESVIIYGQATKVEDAQEKTMVLMELCRKYLPDDLDKAPGDIEKTVNRTTVIKIPVEHITGKARFRHGEA